MDEKKVVMKTKIGNSEVSIEGSPDDAIYIIKGIFGDGGSPKDSPAPDGEYEIVPRKLYIPKARGESGLHVFKNAFGCSGKQLALKLMRSGFSREKTIEKMVNMLVAKGMSYSLAMRKVHPRVAEACYEISGIVYPRKHVGRLSVGKHLLSVGKHLSWEDYLPDGKSGSEYVRSVIDSLPGKELDIIRETAINSMVDAVIKKNPSYGRNRLRKRAGAIFSAVNRTY